MTRKRPAPARARNRQQYGKDAYILMLSHRNDELPLWAHMGTIPTVLCAATATAALCACPASARSSAHMDLFPDATAGLYEDRTAMIVSRGLGGGLPCVGNRPEVVTMFCGQRTERIKRERENDMKT